MDNATITGQAFLLKILSKEKSSKGNNWTWEDYVNGPVSESFADTVCSIAGCWCYDNRSSRVRFYTNGRHERWSR